MSRLGIIADDFTGATDIAGFLVAGGVATAVCNGLPSADAPLDGADAIVICLKIRSVAPEQAVAEALAALDRLQRAGCDRFYYKYCSTFDSTPRGNIGPVAEALLAALGERFTVLCPALPQVGRTVYQGQLFVLGELLAESPMRHHPVNPMTDSSLVRLIEAQAGGRAGVLRWETVAAGAAAAGAALAALEAEGRRFAVLDCIRAEDLPVLAEATAGLRLLTGGSGLADGIARAGLLPRRAAGLAGGGMPRPAGRGAIFSGSCSAQTNRQIAAYRDTAPFRQVDPARCLADAEGHAAELADWFAAQPAEGPFPLISATVDAEALARARRDGTPAAAEAASAAIEATFAALARRLRAAGTTTFLVAGGETSSAVTQALGISAFLVGPQIDPGVPWLQAADGSALLALKSGNFGATDFFARAQTQLRPASGAPAAPAPQEA